MLAHVAAQYGDGFVDLTGRANVQIRGIADVDAVADALVDAGLVPSTTHEKVRNIEVSPFTGRVGGLADLRPLAHELDDALRSDHSLAALSGRFLFGLDDGHTDIAGGGTDVCAVARSRTDGSVGFDIVVDGEIAGSVADDSAVTQALLGVAHDFLEVAGSAWRIADLPESARGDLMAVTRDRLDPPLEPGALAPTAGDPRVGWFDQDDGRVLLGAVVELGRLPARLAEFIAAVEAPWCSRQTAKSSSAISARVLPRPWCASSLRWDSSSTPRHRGHRSAVVPAHPAARAGLPRSAPT